MFQWGQALFQGQRMGQFCQGKGLFGEDRTTGEGP